MTWDHTGFRGWWVQGGELVGVGRTVPSVIDPSPRMSVPGARGGKL